MESPRVQYENFRIGKFSFKRGKKMETNNDIETIKDIEVGDMVEFTYNGSGRVGEVVYKFGFRPNATFIPSHNFSMEKGYITVDTKHDGFKNFKFNKMSDVLIVAVASSHLAGEKKNEK